MFIFRQYQVDEWGFNFHAWSDITNFHQLVWGKIKWQIEKSEANWIKCYFYCKRVFRFSKYQDMSARRMIDPSKLPPCGSSANQHTLRAYFQCMDWRNLDPFPSDPSSWGWKFESEMYSPIQSSKECAPVDLLQFVRCKCKTGCSSTLCSCKKHGLNCVFACKKCRGACENSEVWLKNEFCEKNTFFSAGTQCWRKLHGGASWETRRPSLGNCEYSFD